MASQIDARWMAAAIALSGRTRALSAPNPNVGCLIVHEGRVVGRGYTGQSGRPHAEASALAEAGEAARGATAYVSLEPCAHKSTRGPACADLLVDAGIGRVVAAMADPDVRTAGGGFERLEAAGINVATDVAADAARAAMAGWLSQLARKRPFITLKLATSLDGCIALADGRSKWITGEAARAHAHMERARSNMILVGSGTIEADTPRLDVRLAGLEGRSPQRAILSAKGAAPAGWEVLTSPEGAFTLPHVHYLLVEGGAETAAAFLKAGLVDRLILYRAPVMIGAGKASLGDIGLADLSDAHGQWHLTETRALGSDSLEIYEKS